MRLRRGAVRLVQVSAGDLEGLNESAVVLAEGMKTEMAFYGRTSRTGE